MKEYRIGPYTATHECPSCGNAVIVGPKIEVHTLEEYDNGLECVWVDPRVIIEDLNPEGPLPSDTPITVAVEHDQHFAGTYKGKYFCTDGCLLLFECKITEGFDLMRCPQ